MARTPKPWFWTNRNSYFVTVRGTRHNLGADKDEANRRFHLLMASRPESAPLTTTEMSVVELFDKFLDWCHRHREPRTYEWYRDHIQSFVQHAGTIANDPATALKPFHVVEWADSHSGWSSTYRRGALVAIQRPLNWASKLGYLEANPILHIEKPPPKRRELTVTPDDWKRIKAHYPVGDRFVALLEFAWLTGCRPQETKRIEARHVELPLMRVVFPPAEAKGKRRTRVIHLTSRAAEILAELLDEGRRGPLFVNSNLLPWTAQAMACRFGRLRKHVGVKFCAYAFRHGFSTRQLVEGHDHLTVAELLGHADGRKLATTYQHLAQQVSHLRRALEYPR